MILIRLCRARQRRPIGGDVHQSEPVGRAVRAAPKALHLRAPGPRLNRIFTMRALYGRIRRAGRFRLWRGRGGGDRFAERKGGFAAS